MARRLQPRCSPRCCLPTRDLHAIDQHHKIEEETLPGYRRDDYFSVRIGEIFKDQYQVITKLGYGVYSTVWLCRDLRRYRYVVVKVYVRSSAYGVQAARELRAYERLSHVKTDHPGRAFVRNILGHFKVEGPDEPHVCLVHEPLTMRTSELRPLLPNDRFTTDMLRAFCIYLLYALDFLHTDAGLIHTDIKASNILLENEDESMLKSMEKMEQESPSEHKAIDDERIIYRSRLMPIPKSSGIPILCDFGEARSTEQKYDDDIMPEIYRAPEVIMHMEWDQKADIWNLGA